MIYSYADHFAGFETTSRPLRATHPAKFKPLPSMTLGTTSRLR